MFIPCISPPLIEYILSGFRMGIYAYLDLLLIVKLYLIKKENKKLSNKQLVELVLLSTIVASWKTEAIYYIVFILILLIILGKKIVPLKKSNYYNYNNRYFSSINRKNKYIINWQ